MGNRGSVTDNLQLTVWPLSMETFFKRELLYLSTISVSPDANIVLTSWVVSFFVVAFLCVVLCQAVSSICLR